MRIAPYAVVALLFVARAAPAEDDADVVVRKWLVLAPVDVVARRTLRPDAVFAKYLLDRTSAAPNAGDEITGTLGKPAKWTTKDADQDGDVELENGAWAYASVESPAERVVIAKLEGAGVLFVNGAGFTGDVYRLGDAGVPVALRKGANDVYVAGPRGGFRLSFRKPETHLGGIDRSGLWTELGQFAPADVDEGKYEGLCSSRVLNVTTSPANAKGLDGADVSFAPLGVRRLHGHSTDGDAPQLGKPYRRTFVSNIDGSVQSYAVLPPISGASKDAPVGLVLSLHGAGVECMDQAKAYAPKPDFWIVCPTNRGRYGFDWQDWGRLDAYEVLDDALKVTGVEWGRVYLTGHSMGGHGTWHLAANDPGRFLAIAPSGGWCSFETYQPASQITSPLGWMWRAADGASRTLDLVDNLAQVPTYVLHGEKDDNVRASEARLMIDAVTKAGGNVESHFEPDAGHWWDKDKAPGAGCVDWPGIWRLFKSEPRPHATLGNSQEMTWAGLDDRMHWSGHRLLQKIEYGRPARVSAKSDGGTSVVVTTENVQAFDLSLPQLDWSSPSVNIAVDGHVLEPTKPSGAGLTFGRRGGRWVGSYRDGELEKGPGRQGPFKQAFTNRFLLVYGTAGDDAEDAELLEKARYDSCVWAYRANGDANLMSDAQFLAGDFKDRNVIVYGNADTNSAWTSVFDDDCPIQAKRGTMTVNGTKHDGALAAAFVRPRKGSDVALAAAFADTGAAATRLFYQFPVFSSGVGIPDYVVFGPGFLHEFDGDVRAAGWFDYAWRMR